MNTANPLEAPLPDAALYAAYAEGRADEADARRDSIARAVVRQIDVSPEGSASRMARINAAAKARQVRQDSLAAARAVYRKFGLHNDAEFLASLQNVHASTLGDSPYKAQLMELILDMDADMHEGEPELSSVPTYGEFDAQTVRRV